MRKIYLVMLSLILNGCAALPGLQNIDTTMMQVQETEPHLQTKPVVIPITASYILAHPAKPYVYYLSPYDVLSIMVLNNPELNLPNQVLAVNSNSPQTLTGAAGYIVNPHGNIYFPLIGEVHVTGKTVEEVRRLLVRKLSYYVRRPQIFVRVADFRSKKVYVMGEVNKAGFLPMTDQPLSIIDALNMSGSLDPNTSDPRHIYVIRGSLIRPEIYWLNASNPPALLLGEQFQLQDHDVVIISTASLTRWNRFLSQLLPTLESVWYTKSITNS